MGRQLRKTLWSTEDKKGSNGNCVSLRGMVAPHCMLAGPVPFLMKPDSVSVAKSQEIDIVSSYYICVC